LLPCYCPPLEGILKGRSLVPPSDKIIKGGDLIHLAARSDYSIIEGLMRWPVFNESLICGIIFNTLL
jgi:hypothetical protein